MIEIRQISNIQNDRIYNFYTIKYTNMMDILFLLQLFVIEIYCKYIYTSITIKYTNMREIGQIIKYTKYTRYLIALILYYI